MTLGACLPRPPPDQDALLPEVRLHQVTLRVYRGSTLVATGTAAGATYERSRGRITAARARVHFPASGRAPASVGRGGADAVLEVGSIAGSLPERIAEGSDGLVLTTALGDRVRTDRARLDGRSHTAGGSSGLVVEGPGLRAEAPEFVLALDTERLLLRGGVVTRAEASR